MELHSLLAYGSSVRSVQLLWEMGLLTPLFPELADYLTKEKYPRSAPSAKFSTRPADCASDFEQVFEGASVWFLPS